MQVVLDCETDTLLPEVSKIWCVSVLDTATGTTLTYTDRESFVRDSEAWTEIISFNGLGFDHWVLWKIWNLPFTVGPDSFNGRPVKLTDALVLSRYLFPDRFGQRHKLEVWGEHLGMPKREHEDWTAYSEDMRLRCEQDVRLTYKVYESLLKELQPES